MQVGIHPTDYILLNAKLDNDQNEEITNKQLLAYKYASEIQPDADKASSLVLAGYLSDDVSDYAIEYKSDYEHLNQELFAYMKSNADYGKNVETCSLISNSNEFNLKGYIQDVPLTPKAKKELQAYFTYYYDSLLESYNPYANGINENTYKSVQKIKSMARDNAKRQFYNDYAYELWDLKDKAEQKYNEEVQKFSE
jgi:hypothetical protein